MSTRSATVIPTDGLRLRAAPSTDAAIVGLLSAGEQVTITGESGEWRAVATRLGAGFVHGDYITVDGRLPVSQEPAGPAPAPSAGGASAAVPPPGAAGGTYTVASGDTLSAIGARLGIDWRAIAAANGLSEPFALDAGQVLQLPGAVVVAAGTTTPGPAPSGTADILNPLVFDGVTLVTSSSNQGHHTPYGGNRSCDLDIVGADTPGTSVAFRVSGPPGVELQGRVSDVGLACASGALSDGGHKVQIAIQQRPASGGAWQDSGTWVLYAHLDPVTVADGAIVALGGIVGTLGPAAGGEYDSSCAEGSHVHVEAPGGSWVASEQMRVRGDTVMRIAL